MKLNNKGFAISTIMYMILIMAVILITLTLTLLSSRKLILDKAKQEARDNINSVETVSYRQVLEILKNEAIEYLNNNNLEYGTVKVSDLNASLDNKILNKYQLTDKSLIITYENNEYSMTLE